MLQAMVPATFDSGILTTTTRLKLFDWTERILDGSSINPPMSMLIASLEGTASRFSPLPHHPFAVMVITPLPTRLPSFGMTSAAGMS